MSYSAWNASEIGGGDKAAKRRRLNDCYSTLETASHLHSNYTAQDPPSWTTELHYNTTRSDNAEPVPSTCGTESSGHYCHDKDVFEDSKGCSAACCYGMLSRIAARLEPASQALVSLSSLNVVFQVPNILRHQQENARIVFEITSPIQAKIISELVAAADIECHLYCYKEPGQVPDGQTRRQRGKEAQPWYLNAILYGPSGLEEAIGEFLSKNQMYLQDPLGCDRRVPYRNPHVIPPETGEILMTDPLRCLTRNLEIERLDVGPDLLAKLMQDEAPLAETEAPDIVTTELYSHQKQALTFMLRREQGWQLEEASQDIWTKVGVGFGRYKFRNNVTGISQEESPRSFQGGLLADDMGLGKTLTMISLIASNQALEYLPSPSITPKSPGNTAKTTLLIVPPPLIQSWVKQFKMHIRLGTLKIHVFHGQNRKGVDFLRQFDVVITTYHTISSIWRKLDESNEAAESVFSVNWHRLVLDEAHTIQNATSDLAQACCALHSSNRWAITGTPIQNKLTDFASLVKFLQVYPYSELEIFDKDISRPWRGGEQQGFLRLKALVRAITISRSKAIVNLPPRADYIHHLDFSGEERLLYDDAKKQTVVLLQAAISSSQGGRTFNALQRLNTLRLICSHGLLAQSNQGTETSCQAQSSAAPYTQSYLQDPFYEAFFVGRSFCCYCGMDLLEDFLEGSPSAGLYAGSVAPKSGPIMCERCQIQFEIPETRSSRLDEILGLPRSPFSPLSQSPSPSIEDEQAPFSLELMPTKVKALVTDLLHHSSSEKSVVFSYWTYTLNLVQAMLVDSRIKYTRIDGKTTLPRRTEAVRSFQADPSLRVILVSITCGGAGLDLTAASRAYLLEPHWNPMIEEQALCRVHRIGQRRNVTTIRYLMRDSFEEQVVEIQKRKKKLAEVTFGHDELSEAGICIGTLRYLKSVLE